MELIEHIKPALQKKKDRFYMNKLLSFNDRNVSYLLHRIDKNYKMALEHFLNTKPLNQLMDFIHVILEDIRGDKEKDLEVNIRGLKQFLVKNISLIFRIDKDDALNIFYELGETTLTIYSLIEEHMGDRLHFLTAVLNKFEHEDFDLKEKILLDQLAEVCMLPDDQMLQYLNTYYYPLDPAIAVCEQKGNLLAKAILEERCGRIKEAFISYERIVKNIIQSNGKFTESQVKKDVQKYTKECIRLCKKFSGEHKSEESFWLRMIIFVNGFIKSNHQHKVFLKIEFEKMLQTVLTQMFEFLPTTLLIEFFTSKVNKLELSLSKEFSIYTDLFILIRFDIGIAAKVMDICKLDVKGSRKEALVSRVTHHLFRKRDSSPTRSAISARTLSRRRTRPTSTPACIPSTPSATTTSLGASPATTNPTTPSWPPTYSAPTCAGIRSTPPTRTAPPRRPTGRASGTSTSKPQQPPEPKTPKRT